MNNKKKLYRVAVENKHANIEYHDFPVSHETFDAAIDELIQANLNDIEDEVKSRTDGIIDFDTDSDAWYREYDRLMAAKRAEIAKYGYDDGNRHHFYIREEEESV